MYFFLALLERAWGYTLPPCGVGGDANEAGRVHDMYSHPTYPKILFVYEAFFVYELFSSTKRFVYEYSSTKGGAHENLSVWRVA